MDMGSTNAAVRRYAEFNPQAPQQPLKEHWKYSALPLFAQALVATKNDTEALQVVGTHDAKPLTAKRLNANALTAHETLAANLDWAKYPLADGLFSSGDGWQLDVGAGSRLEAQLRLADGQGYGLVQLGNNATAELVLDIESNAEALGTLLIDLLPDAKLTLDVSALSAQGLSWLCTRVRLAERASLTLRQYYAASGKHRSETQVLMTGADSHAELLGASIAGQDSSLDQQIIVEHQSAGASSQQRFHCVGLAGSQSNFNGRIHIHPGASQSLAELQNRNLALAADAQLNTKPELEIYNDDVRCAHGATIGQLDPEAVFYCRSRGIAEPQARRLLTAGFLKQCVDGPRRDAVLASIESRIQ